MNTEELAKGMTATGPSPDDSFLRRERLPPRTRQPLRHLHKAKCHGGPQRNERRTRRSIHRWAVSNRGNSEQAAPFKPTTMPSGLQPRGRGTRPPYIERSKTCRQRPARVALRKIDCGHFAAAPSPDHRRARDRAKPPLPQQFFCFDRPHGGADSNLFRPAGVGRNTEDCQPALATSTRLSENVGQFPMPPRRPAATLLTVPTGFSVRQ